MLQNGFAILRMFYNTACLLLLMLLLLLLLLMPPGWPLTDVVPLDADAVVDVDDVDPTFVDELTTENKGFFNFFTSDRQSFETLRSFGVKVLTTEKSIFINFWWNWRYPAKQARKG